MMHAPPTSFSRDSRHGINSRPVITTCTERDNRPITYNTQMTNDNASAGYNGAAHHLQSPIGMVNSNYQPVMGTTTNRQQQVLYQLATEASNVEARDMHADDANYYDQQ